MNKQKLITEILALTRSQAVNEQMDIDFVQYRQYLNKKDVDDLDCIYQRKRYMLSDRYKKDIDREINRLERGGMFNIGNMSPKHALD